MLEESLKAKGVSREELDEFAELPLHNSKKDIFRRIATASNWRDFGKTESSFLNSLAESLAELGEDVVDISGSWRGYLGEKRYKLLVAQKIAIEMLTTLNRRGYRQHENIPLNKIYDDTFERVRR